MLTKCRLLCLTVFLSTTLAAICPVASFADTAITDVTATDATIPKELHYQVGWQISQAASGFSIKIPVINQFYIQPLFVFSMNQKTGTTSPNAKGHLAVGLRGSYRLPERGNFQPYVGAGWGHTEDFAGASLTQTAITKGSTGFEVFLGVEYQKYVFRPTLEIGLGTYARADGSSYAGTTFNLGLMYSF